jgi:serine protease Do
VTVFLSDGRATVGKTLGMHMEMDAGLVKIQEDRKWPFLEMGASEKVEPGQWCLATGHPDGYQRGRKPVLRVGRVLANRQRLIFTDCLLTGGDSGGPLVNLQGEVVGVHSRISRALTGNMHVPVDIYRSNWKRLASGEAWGFIPFIGVVADPEADVARIGHVYPDHPADKAGIEVGDVVTQFDGKPVKDFAELAEMVRTKKPGDKVGVQVQRGSETVKLEVRVGWK